MSALAVEPGPARGSDWDELVRVWKETDAPEGSKVEIIEGIVTVPPTPSRDHNTTAAKLARSLYSVIPEDWEVYQTLGIEFPSTQNLFVPDIAVVPVKYAVGPGNRVAAEHVELVAEITSKNNANHDRVKKVRGYAMGGIPLYLLLDPWHSGRPTATLYGEPTDGTYRVLASGEYGEVLKVPAPFSLELDTGTFPIT
ncbi:Uma2 family endonuclease [Streptomyces sp. NPDC001904]|uniref:Uma2 family endonuclease n=1 Tax=Streptomyces sp. NPDC001904 TaxID=3154531 RepID=UPI00332B0711